MSIRTEIIRHTPYIFEYSECISNPELVIQEIPDSEWQEYTNNGGGSTIVGKCSHIPHNSNTYDEINNAFVATITQFAYENNVPISSNNLDAGAFVVRQYQAGSFMTAHQDAYGYIKKGNDFAKPIITALLYLNDDYIGGELSFPNEGIKIKPKKGSIVVFLSNIDHEVLTILDGDRYLTSIYAYEKEYSYYKTETMEK